MVRPGLGGGWFGVMMGLEETYRLAIYRVLGHHGFDFRVGQHSVAITGVFDTHGVSSAAFLTAYNPRGKPTSDTLNIAQQTKLESELKSRGVSMLAGIGLDSNEASEWPGEPSIMALGVSLEMAVGLGHRYRQLAIVWIPETATPELIML